MNSKQTLHARPIEPAPAYENGHQIARDLLQHIELQLDRMVRPDTPITFCRSCKPATPIPKKPSN